MTGQQYTTADGRGFAYARARDGGKNTSSNPRKTGRWRRAIGHLLYVVVEWTCAIREEDVYGEHDV